MSDADQPGLEYPPGRWLHRLATVAVVLVWPLIWVGGLVTTYDAGMAVPDWPNTYGYNLFLYPYDTWLLGPFDLFIEHGHRLLAAVVGVVSIAIVVAAFWAEPRQWVRVLAVGVLLAVIGQGLLGGVRVVLSDRTFAMIHGCVGPAFFALCVVAMVVTSRWWWRAPAAASPGIGRGLLIAAVGLVLLSYVQLVLGAQLRHTQPTMSPVAFTHVVKTHVALAFLLWGWVLFLGARLRGCGDLTLFRPALVLIGLVSVQILLGIGTWVVNYSWPTLLAWVPGSSRYVIQAQGFSESMIVTAHVATGSLILAVATLLALRVGRVRRVAGASTSASAVSSSAASAPDAALESHAF